MKAQADSHSMNAPRIPRWSLFVLLIVVGGGEGALLWQWRQEGWRAAALLAARQAEGDQWQRRQPVPTVTHEAAIADDLATRRTRLAWLGVELMGRGEASSVAGEADGPAERTEVFFAIAAMRDHLKALAQVRGVRLDGHAADFGFGAFASEAPTVDRLANVNRQRAVLRDLVEALLESGPRAVLSIQRETEVAAARSPEYPMNVIPSGVRKSGGGRGIERGDSFALDRGVSVAVPGLLETLGFRLVFCGDTEVLRVFLNRVSHHGRTLVIRDVEVSPASAVEAGASPATSGDRNLAAKPAAPLVTRPLSRFAVTIESIERVVPDHRGRRTTPPVASTGAGS